MNNEKSTLKKKNINVVTKLKKNGEKKLIKSGSKKQGKTKQYEKCQRKHEQINNGDIDGRNE